MRGMEPKNNQTPKQVSFKKNTREQNLNKAKKNEVINVLTDEEEKLDLETQMIEEHFKY